MNEEQLRQKLEQRGVLAQMRENTEQWFQRIKARGLEDIPRLENGIPILSIKYNSVSTDRPCELCGTNLEPEIGPWLFIDGTWDIVCETCGLAFAPDLESCLHAYWTAYYSGELM